MSLQLQTIPTLCCPTFGHSAPTWWRKRSGIEWILLEYICNYIFLSERGCDFQDLLDFYYNTTLQFPVSRMRMCLVWARVCLHTWSVVIYFAGKFEAWKLQAIPSSVASRHAARFATRKVRVMSRMERSVIYHQQYSLLHFNFIQKRKRQENESKILNVYNLCTSTCTHILVVWRWWIWYHKKFQLFLSSQLHRSFQLFWTFKC